MSGRALVVSAVVLTCACASAPRLTYAPRVNAALSPGKPATCAIDVFRDVKPDRAHSELGVINFHQEWHRALGQGQALAQVLPQIKARACQAGADAVVIHVTEQRRLEWAMLHVAATVVRFDR